MRTGVKLATVLSGGARGLQSLFANGESGFLFDGMSDLTRLFTTGVGPTQVAANDDPVGLALENSRWVGKTLEQVLAEKPTLVTNGTFDAGITGWSDASTAPATFTWGAVSQRAVLTRVDANNARMEQLLTTVAGRMYAIDVAATFTDGGAMRVQVGATQAASDLLPATTVPTGVHRFYFVATGTTSWIRFFTINIGVSLVDNVAVKEVPGNHAVQATANSRPWWKANNGKPYLNFDGLDDRTVNPYIPNSAGTAAVAFRGSTASGYAMGGGTTTGNKRLRMGLNASGFPEFDYNDQFNAFSGLGDRRNTDIIMVQTWDAATRECWADGAQLLSEARVSNLDGTGSGFALGSIESATSFLSGRVYAALALSRKVTPSEIARITSQFQQRL